MSGLFGGAEGGHVAQHDFIAGEIAAHPGGYSNIICHLDQGGNKMAVNSFHELYDFMPTNPADV